MLSSSVIVCVYLPIGIRIADFLSINFHSWAQTSRSETHPFLEREVLSSNNINDNLLLLSNYRVYHKMRSLRICNQSAVFQFLLSILVINNRFLTHTQNPPWVNTLATVDV